MLTYNPERSFVAFVQCNTPEFEGYLDCGELAVKGGEPMRRAADWLTVTSFKDKQPHRFWFRCLEDGEGNRYFDIQSWSRRTGRDRNPSMRHTSLSHNGYVGLYDAPNAHETLWQVMVFDGEQSVHLPEPLALGKIESVEIITYMGAPLCACKREEVGHLWHAYVGDSGGPLLTLTLDVVDLGEELLDDH